MNFVIAVLVGAWLIIVSAIVIIQAIKLARYEDTLEQLWDRSLVEHTAGDNKWVRIIIGEAIR